MHMYLQAPFADVYQCKSLLYKQAKLKQKCFILTQMMFWDVAAELYRIPTWGIWETAWFGLVWTCNFSWIENQSCVEYELFIDTHKKPLQHVYPVSTQFPSQQAPQTAHPARQPGMLLLSLRMFPPALTSASVTVWTHYCSCIQAFRCSVHKCSKEKQLFRFCAHVAKIIINREYVFRSSAPSSLQRGHIMHMQLKHKVQGSSVRFMLLQNIKEG